MRKKWLKRIAIGLLSLLLLGSIAFIAWGLDPLEAMPIALNALESDNKVLVIPKTRMVFTPQTLTDKTGVIIYPGGHVDPRAYAPLAKAIAKEGYLVILPRMPLNLAIFGINKAQEIMQANPQIEIWVIGGHSLGGAMAAEYVAKNPNEMAGLFLWASYSAENTDLSQLENLNVLSIYGTEDGSVEALRQSRERLPDTVTWVEMEGANHAQFGWYGLQPGDGVAAISREMQQAIILEETLQFLASID